MKSKATFVLFFKDFFPFFKGKNLTSIFIYIAQQPKETTHATYKKQIQKNHK